MPKRKRKPVQLRIPGFGTNFVLPVHYAELCPRIEHYFRSHFRGYEPGFYATKLDLHSLSIYRKEFNILMKCLVSGLKVRDRAYYFDEIDLSDNCLKSILHISRLDQWNYGLKELDLSYNFIESLKGIERLTSLTHLNLSYNYITDFTPLQPLKKLETLNVSVNRTPRACVHSDRRIKVKIFDKMNVDKNSRHSCLW